MSSKIISSSEEGNRRGSADSVSATDSKDVPGAAVTQEALDSVSSNLSSSPLRHMSLSRPHLSGRRLPTRESLRASIFGLSDSEVAETVGVKEREAKEEPRSRAETAPTGELPVKKAAPVPAPRKPVRKDKKTESTPPSSSPLTTAGPPPACNLATADYRASDLHLTDLQRLEVMELVKQGKLTVDEAMKKVLEVEQQLRQQVSKLF